MKKIVVSFLLLLAPLVVFADPPAGGIGIGGGTGTTATAQTGTVTPPPSVFDGGTSAPDLSAPPPVDGTAITSVQANAQQQEQEGGAAAAADVASNISQCGQPNTGAALQQALSSVGPRLGRAALQGLANGLSSYGVLGQAAGRILTGSSVGDAAQGVLGTAGSYAGNYVGQEIAGACGDSSLGRQICGTVGSAVGNYVNGAINQYGGQILSNIGLGNVNLGSIGGSLGGVLGSAGSLFGGGGGSVPVSDQGTQTQIQHASQSADRIATNIFNTSSHIDQQTGLLVYNTCESQPMVAALNTRAAANTQATILQAAAGQAVTNQSTEVQTARITEGMRVYNDPSLSSDQREFVRTLLSNQENGVNICDGSAPTTGSFGSRMLSMVSYQSNCSYPVIANRVLQAENNGERAYRDLTNTTSGPRPTGVCGEDGPNAGQTNHPELCPTTYHVAVQSSDIAALQQRAEGHQFDLSTSAIGAAADRLGAQLIDEIFTTVANEAESGLQRLVSNRTNGSSGRGSYLDRLSGNVGPTQQQATGYLTQNITDALSIEAQYQEGTQSILDGLVSTQNVFKDLQACYATLAAHPAGSITADAAQTATDNASTTVNIILGRQITARQQNIDASQSAVNDLGVLLDRIQATTRSDQINTFADTYNAMIAGGRLHTTEELQLLADDVNQLVPALALAQQDGQAQLTQCRAYGTAAPTGG